MNPAFDPVAALRVLREEGVRFVVIGGFAGELLGAPLITNDLDICYDRSQDNLERLAAALIRLHARLRVANVDEDLPFVLDARTLAAGDSFTFITDHGSLDVLGTPSGTAGYSDVIARAHDVLVGEDLRVPVVALEDLMRMKRASARVKDRLQLEVLSALAETLESGE
ncbi:MAG: hypothetical protein ACRD1D_01465 [Acidimicrobiales bacterium]